MNRDAGPSNKALFAALQDISRRLERLESGGAIAGNISLAALHRLFDIQVEIIDTGSGHRIIRYTSPSGATSDVVL